MGRDSSLVCHCHSQTHSHKPASQHSSGLSSIHTGLSAPNSSLRRRCSPQSAHLPAVGRLAAAASLTAGDYPWGKSSLNYRILNNCPHRPPGCSVARCVVTNTTLTWQKCAQPPRATTQLILAGSLLTELYTLSEILSRYERSYTTNPARVEAINA